MEMLFYIIKKREINKIFFLFLSYFADFFYLRRSIRAVDKHETFTDKKMAYCDSCCGNSDILLFTVGFFIFYAIGPKIKILKTTSCFEISSVGILKVRNFCLS